MKTTTKTIKPEGDNYGGYAIQCASWRCHKPAKYYEPDVSVYAFDDDRVVVTSPVRIDWIFHEDDMDRYDLRQRITLPGLRYDAVTYANCEWRWYCGVHARMAKIVKRNDERRANDERRKAQRAALDEREAADAIVRAQAAAVRAAEQAIVSAATGLYADPSTATLNDLRAAVEALGAVRAAQARA